MPQLDKFRDKVREYRILAHRNQSDLASYLGIDYTELSNRLHAYKRTRLTHDNIRGIVRALAEWSAITTQAQATELLDLMAAPDFDPVDWQAPPLNKLKPGLAPGIASSFFSQQVVQPVSQSKGDEPKTNWPELDYASLKVTRVEVEPELVYKQIGIVNAGLLEVIRRIDSSKTAESSETLKNFFLKEYKIRGWIDISVVAHLVSGFKSIVENLEETGGFSIVFQRYFFVSAVTVTPALLAWNYFPGLTTEEKLINIVQIDLVHHLRPAHR